MVRLLLTSFAASCCAVELGALRGDGHLAAELGHAIADIAGRVALQDGYGDEFADFFGAGLRSDAAPVSKGDGAVALLGAHRDADRALVLQSPSESPEAFGDSMSALMSSASSERAAAKEAYAATWQRMLDAEKQAIHNIARATVVSKHAAARHVMAVGALAASPASVGMADLQAVAKQAAVVAHGFAEEARGVPSLATAASDIDKANAGMIAALQARSVVEEQGKPVAFLQTARLATPGVANIRLVEPEARSLHEMQMVRHDVLDALATLEERQRSDEEAYASLLSSSHALRREALLANSV